MSWWPFIGGLHRLLKYRRLAAGPAVLGGTLLGGAFCSGIAALAAVSMGSADPVVWILALAGRSIGSLIVGATLLLNIPTICLLVYFAALSIQQIRSLARLPLANLTGALFVPVIVMSCMTSWTSTHVTAIAAYCGVVFVSITGIAIADYHCLRRQRIALDQIFNASPQGDYWYWRGVNVVGVGTVLLSTAAYLLIYDPVTLATASVFRYFGATIPVMVGSAALYLVLTALIVIPLRRGGYHMSVERTSEVAVGL